MTKLTKWHVRPAKTHIKLCIRPVWSESSMSARSKRWSLAIRWAHSEDSDQTERMPMLIWVFARLWLCPVWSVFAGRTDHFVGFVMGRLILCRSSKLPNQSYIMFKKQEQYPKTYPLYILFLAGTVCRTSPNYSTVARENVRIALNHRRCPRAMSSRYNVWNSSYCQLIFIPTSSIWFWHRVLVYQNTQLYKWLGCPVCR